MRQIAILTILGLLISCSLHENLTFNPDKIELIEIYQGYPGTKIEMKEGFEKEFIEDLNESKELGPTKYMKTHRILIHYKFKKTDTIYTNGSIHTFKNWYKSDENLIDKYSIKQNFSIEAIAEQLKTIQNVKKLLNEKKYDEAILLFSKEQQKNINEIKKKPEMFKYWCFLWTLDDVKYDRCVKRTKAGKGIFVVEDNEWKLDEN